jgi:hypothetical protein
MQTTHIAGLVIAGLLAVWALYVVFTREKGESVGGTVTVGRFFLADMLRNQPPDDLPKGSLNPGIQKGAKGPPTGGPPPAGLG